MKPLNNSFAAATANPSPPADKWVKAFFSLMKTSAPGPLEKMLDQYPGMLETKGSPSGGTPIVYAAELGRLDLVKLFHEKNANLLASDNGDQSALFYAGHKGHPDIAMYLIDLGVDPLAKNKAGISPAMAAVAADFPSFGKQMEERREKYLAAQAEIARQKAIADEKARIENARQVTEIVRHGTANEVSAPEKASFKPRIR